MARMIGSRSISIDDTPLEVTISDANNPINLATDIAYVCGRVVEIDDSPEEYVDIWTPGGQWMELGTARQHNIVSTDLDDTLLGDGARTVEVSGLDGSYNPISETVNMLGLVDVLTVSSYKIIHKLRVITAGDTGYNEGTITATAAIDSQLMAEITPTFNESLMAIYQIPDGYTGYITNVFSTTNRSSSSSDPDTRMLIKPFGEVFQTKLNLFHTAEGSAYVFKNYQIPYRVEAKSIIKLQLQAEVDDTDMASGFDIALVPN